MVSVPRAQDTLVLTASCVLASSPSNCQYVVMRKIGAAFGLWMGFKLILSHINAGKQPLFSNS